MFCERVKSGGHTEWLVLLHGFCGNSRMWEKQVNFFKHYYNLLLIDLPGHGESTDGLVDKNIQSFEELGVKIVKLLKEEGIEKANFLGASLGSMVIGGILKANPDCVNKVILGDAVIVSNKFSIAVVKLVEKIQRFIPYRLILYVGNFILMPSLRHWVVKKFYMKSGSRLGQKEFNIWFSLIIKELHILESINYSKKTLFISGTGDIHFKKGVERVIESQGLDKFELIDKTGHVCCMEKCEEFNIKVLKFLREK